MGNQYICAIVLLLVVLSSCAAPPNVGKIEEKKPEAVSAAPQENASGVPEKVDTTITSEDDALEREIKEMLKESDVATEEVAEKPATTPKKKTTSSAGKPGGLGSVKGVIELAPAKKNTSIEPERAADGSIIVSSSRGFKGEPVAPRGVINLKITNSTTPSQKKPIDADRSPTRSTSGPSPYEALLNATRLIDNQSRR